MHIKETKFITAQNKTKKNLPQRNVQAQMFSLEGYTKRLKKFHTHSIQSLEKIKKKTFLIYILVSSSYQNQIKRI